VRVGRTKLLRRRLIHIFHAGSGSESEKNSYQIHNTEYNPYDPDPDPRDGSPSHNTRVADPHSFHPDLDPAPAFKANTDPDPIRIQGFKDQKIKKKLLLKKKNWDQKNTIYLSIGLHTESLGYRRSLQLSKAIQRFKT
jgi:hypothetical protein